MVLYRQKHPAALTSLVVLSGIAAVTLFIFRYEFLSWDFRNNLWGPAYLLTHGQDPFRVYLLFPGTNALWSPTAVGFFFYLGLFPLKIATNLWLLVNILAGMSLVFAFWWQKKPRILLLLGCLLLVFLSPVIISHLLFGQASLFFVICSLASAWLIGAKKIGLAAIVIAVGLIKPQLAILVLPGMLIGIWRLKNVGGVAKFVAYLLLSSLIFLVPVWLGYPQWVDGYLNAFRINPEWSQPTLLRIIQSYLPSWGVVLWIGAFGLAMVLTISTWLRNPPIHAAALTLALTALVSPYLWSYDFVLLIPYFLLTLTNLRKKLWLWAYSLIWLMVSFIAMVIRLVTDNNDIRYWWIPWVILLSGVLISQLDQTNNAEHKAVPVCSAE